ncbi:MAG: deoxyribodipyrimidine photo-lyase [Pseudomonadota bacterium]
MSDDRRPALMWFRRDLRLADNAALTAAAEADGPVIPVFILDPETEAMGAAPKWRLGLSIADLAGALEEAGSRLILRRGKAREVLEALVEETGAGAVHWLRLYDPASIKRDTEIKAMLNDAGVEAVSHAGHTLHEPWVPETQQGGFYKVYSPFWRAVSPMDVAEPLPAPKKLPAPDDWPSSEALDDWQLGAAMRRGAAVVADYTTVGEAAARDRLDAFIADAVGRYKTDRNRTDLDATSNLSENLTYGEISPRTIWHAGRRAMEEGAKGAEHFLKELVWRDFAWHLLYHTPHITEGNWREGWDEFPWRDDNADAERWRRGLTGEPMVDAGMRELYITGRMHNRTRMIVASYLTKHLMTHWRIGLDWFADCLIDWDPASNAMGWQWTAGSGPDAAPYFRVFNPETQAEKFDPKGSYRRRWLAGWEGESSTEAKRFFDAIPESWDLSAEDTYPDRLIALKEGRERALAAYKSHTADGRKEDAA